MSENYIVLARKWRPMTFENVVGQEHITRTIKKALENGRLGHGFIFAGPRGVGKTTTARLLAKAVNCQNGEPGDPCNNCDNCNSINAGNHLDVIEIDGASNRGIDEIRNLRENIRFSPASAKFKVYIIDEIHMLSKEAFNALLKTLEEPPSHAIFIFATTEIHRVPLTILSRCQRFDFRRIPTSAIVTQLQKIADQEKIAIDPEALHLIARKADGGMRDATSILDQLSAFTGDQVTAEQVQETLGVLGDDLFFEYTNLMQTKDDAAILGFAARLFERGVDTMNLMQGLELHFRNIYVARATGSSNSLDVSDFYKEKYLETAQSFTEKDLLHYLEILVQHTQLLRFSENPQLMLELLLLKLAHKPLSLDIQELLDLLNNSPGSNPGSGGDEPPPPRRPVPSAPSPSHSAPPVSGRKFEPPAPQSSGAPDSTKTSLGKFGKLPIMGNFPPASKPEAQPEKQTVASEPSDSIQVEITIDDIRKKWNSLLGAVRREKIALASFLQDGVAKEVDGQIVHIAFDAKTGFHKDHVQKNAAIIENELKKIFGVTLKIQTLAVDFEEAGIQKTTQSPEEVFENMKNKEPVLKKIIELFDCENTD